jgi:mono/diheme cytochrome c family protein
VIVACALWAGGERSAEAREPTPRGAPGKTPGKAPRKAPKAPPKAPAKAPPVDPAALFTKLGCPVCHAPGARYHAKILTAPSKPAEDLARWIRNPEKFIPNTAMPTYDTLLDEPSALAVARWLKEAGPGAPTHR